MPYPYKVHIDTNATFISIVLDFIIMMKTGTFENSEDSDGMAHNAVFHQGLHC